MKLIILRMSNGQIAYCRPLAPMFEGETEDAYLARIAETTIRKNGEADPRFRGAVVLANIPPEGVPTDSVSWRYRQAWDWLTPDPKIEINLEKAKPIHRDYLRALRAQKFEPIERAQRTALANGDTTAAQRCEAQLQALRDAPADPRIDGATTLAELAAVIPSALA